MPLIHWQVFRTAVDLPCARVDDADVAVVAPARLQYGQLSPTVDVQIRVGVNDRVHVARLAREIEENVMATDELTDAVLVTDGGAVDGYLLFGAVHIEKVTAGLRDE